MLFSCCIFLLCYSVLVFSLLATKSEHFKFLFFWTGKKEERWKKKHTHFECENFCKELMWGWVKSWNFFCGALLLHKYCTIYSDLFFWVQFINLIMNTICECTINVNTVNSKHYFCIYVNRFHHVQWASICISPYIYVLVSVCVCLCYQCELK